MGFRQQYGRFLKKEEYDTLLPGPFVRDEEGQPFFQGERNIRNEITACVLKVLQEYALATRPGASLAVHTASSHAGLALAKQDPNDPFYVGWNTPLERIVRAYQNNKELCAVMRNLGEVRNLGLQLPTLSAYTLPDGTNAGQMLEGRNFNYRSAGLKERDHDAFKTLFLSAADQLAILVDDDTTFRIPDPYTPGKTIQKNTRDTAIGIKFKPQYKREHNGKVGNQSGYVLRGDGQLVSFFYVGEVGPHVLQDISTRLKPALEATIAQLSR